MSDKHITVVVKDYIDKHISENGEPLSFVYLSKQRIQEYERELGISDKEKIDNIYGVKVLSHTYEKYREVEI